jgi:hypothetical protein
LIYVRRYASIITLLYAEEARAQSEVILSSGCVGNWTVGRRRRFLQAKSKE